MSGTWVSLHTHTDFSPLDGAGRIRGYFEYAAELGMPALGITDHGSMSGHWDAWNIGKEVGVKPILGSEIYVAPEDLRVKEPVRWGTEDQRPMDVGGGGKYLHQTMVALNPEGLRNMYKMQYVAITEGFYGAPRFDVELMSQHSQGILVTSGCAGSAVSVRLRLGQWDEAVKYAATMKEIYGENFFIEVMSHEIAEDDLNDYKLNQSLIKLAKHIGVPLVATNDCHYVRAENADAHDTFLCIQTGRPKSDPNRFKFNGHGFHLKSYEEMVETARHGGFPVEAVHNTVEIAERVESYDPHFAFKDRMPIVPGSNPDEQDEELEFRSRVALLEKFGDSPRYAEYEARRVYELEVMAKAGVSGYHLTLGYILTWAKSQGIRIGPCRGSAGGSLICYLTNISGVDPVRFNLPFERYLNLDRVSMPDVDVDIEIERRGEVVNFVRDTWGEKHVTKILTLGTIKAKAAIKDAGRILGFEFAVGNELTKLFPEPIAGFTPTLSCVFDKTDKRYGDAKALRERINSDEDARSIYEMALQLEGLIRNFGVHAAGIIISSDPLDEVIPLRLPSKKEMEDDRDIVSGFDQPAMEPLGLYKYDFLGLENLTIINRALDFIEKLYDKKIIIEDVPLDDKKVYDGLSRGDSLGCFQLDSPGMQRLLKQMRPDRFEDLSAVLALYRPGPMGVKAHEQYADRKTGREKVVPIHEELRVLDDVLGDTYGVICYQEQIMQSLQLVAGYSLGEADNVRRIMGKKKPEAMAKLEPELRERMLAKGYSEEAFEALWEIMVPFSMYGFNRAHTIGYGMIAYWTAWLKFNYPIAYFAALLTSQSDDQDKLNSYLESARNNGVKILPPDLNESESGFTPTKKGIRYGLGSIKGVGESVLSQYTGVTIKDSEEFYRNIPSQINTRTLLALIQSGALDFLGDRVQHVENYERWIERAKETKKFISHGDQPLIPGGYTLRPTQSNKDQMRVWEAELLGSELTQHSLSAILGRPLTDNEWTWLFDLLAHYAGDQPLELCMGGVRFTTGQRIAGSDKLVASLKSLSAFKEVKLE